MVSFVGSDFQDHLIVDLKDEPRFVLVGSEGLVKVHQGHLEDVCCKALDSGVHRLTFTSLTNAEVRGCEFWDLSTPPKQRFGVTALSGLGDRSVHVLTHCGEGFEVGLKYLGCLLDRYGQALA